MLRLRPYKAMDNKYLIEWMEDEKTFVQWCAKHFRFPLSNETLVEYEKNCDNSEDSWLLTAIDEKGKPVGHVLVKYVNLDENSIHLGHVIVDSKNRCKGLGKELLKLVLIYAFDVLRVSKVTLGVFDNNPVAYNCYKALGFEEYEYFEKKFPYHDEMWGCYNMQIQKDEDLMSII